MKQEISTICDHAVNDILKNIEQTGCTFFEHKVIGSTTSNTSLIILDLYGKHVHEFKSENWGEDLYTVFLRHVNEAEIQWSLKNGIVPGFILTFTANELREVLPNHDFWILNNSSDEEKADIAYDRTYDEITITLRNLGQLTEYHASNQAREILINRAKFKNRVTIL